MNNMKMYIVNRKLGTTEDSKNYKLIDVGEGRGDAGFMIGYENRKRVSMLFFLLQTLLKSEGRDNSFWTSNKSYGCSLLHFHWILSGLYETWRKTYTFRLVVFIWLLTLKPLALSKWPSDPSVFKLHSSVCSVLSSSKLSHLMHEHPCLDTATRCWIHLWLLWRCSHKLSYLQHGLLPNSCPTIKGETQNSEVDPAPSPGYMDSCSSC